MKKVFAVVLTFCLIFSSVSAFALTGDEIFKEYTNYDAHLKMSMKLEQYPQALVDEFQDDFFDIKKFIEGFNDTGYEADVKLNANEDFTKMTANANADLSFPLMFNDRLEIGVNASTNMWLDMDVSDFSNLKYKVIYLTPASNKYMYIDNAFEFAKFDEYQYEELKKAFDFAVDKGFRDKINEIIKKNSKLDVSSDKITLTVDAKGIKSIVADFLELLWEKEILKGVDTVKLAEIKAMVLAFPVEEDTVITTECTYKNGEISFEKSHMDICLDINKINEYVNKLSNVESEIVIDGDARVKLSFDVECVYNSVNKPLEITLPDLTDENSIDLTEMGQYQADEYIPEEFHHDKWYNIHFDMSEEDGDIHNVKIPGKNVLNGLGMYGYSYEISKQDLLDIKKGWWKDDISIKENSSEFIRNGETIPLSVPFNTFEEGFTIAQIEEIFRLKYDRVLSYDYEYGEIEISFENPDFVAPVYEIKERPNTIETWRSVTVQNDGYTGYKKSDIKLDFKKVIEGFAIEESDVVNANGNINFRFYNRYITFTPGSNVIIVDGEEVTIDKPVEEIEGGFLVSCDFVEKAFNCTLESVYFISIDEREVSRFKFTNNSFVHIDW